MYSISKKNLWYRAWYSNLPVIATQYRARYRRFSSINIQELYLWYRAWYSILTVFATRQHPISKVCIRYRVRYRIQYQHVRRSGLVFTDIDEIVFDIEYTDFIYGHRVRYALPTSVTISCLPPGRAGHVPGAPTGPASWSYTPFDSVLRCDGLEAFDIQGSWKCGAPPPSGYRKTRGPGSEVSYPRQNKN